MQVDEKALTKVQSLWPDQMITVLAIVSEYEKARTEQPVESSEAYHNWLRFYADTHPLAGATWHPASNQLWNAACEYTERRLLKRESGTPVSRDDVIDVIDLAALQTSSGHGYTQRITEKAAAALLEHFDIRRRGPDNE